MRLTAARPWSGLAGSGRVWPAWIIALVLAVVVVPLTLSSSWQRIDSAAFDLFSTLGPSVPDQPGAIIVAIDEPSMTALAQQWPWPRSRHAELVAALRQAGAKAIAFDIVYAERSQPDQDRALAAVGGPDLVFAADESVIERDYGVTRIVTEPVPEVLGGGTRIGIASLTADGDGGLRRMPGYANGFSAELARAAGADRGEAGQPDRLIQHFGPAGSYPTVSYYQALEPDKYLPPGFFRDQTVVVGFALQAGAEVEAGGVDAFVTPFTRATGLLTPGVEVQATILDNLLHDLAIAPPPRGTGMVLVVLGAFLALASARVRTLGLRVGVSLAVIAAMLLAAWLALRFGRLWLSPVDPAAAFTLVNLGIGVRDFAAERRRRREVQRAFGQYVAPSVVDRIIASPELLQLGGEKRDMTILFADIRGFTTICEAMKHDPIGLTRLINDILTPLSEIVIARGGTIDKYMGDCIMAFWNAPLDDRDHALHAIEAAEAMIAAMPAINETVAARLPGGTASAPGVRIGIGINSGECVVGNMGSTMRFDYSVLGDPVNIASRLESLCKTYDVPLVIGQTTMEAVGTGRVFRQLDRIAVRGRSEAEAIYTVDAV